MRSNGFMRGQYARVAQQLADGGDRRLSSEFMRLLSAFTLIATAVSRGVVPEDAARRRSPACARR